MYGGIYEPGHPMADEQGFRRDVLEMVRRLGVSVVRYPGGNFVSGFNWEDSVGSDRPSRLDLAWFTTESNAVGLHEFADWAGKADTEIMYAINLGTRGPENARDIVEYANHPGGSKFSDMRIANGAKDPLNIRLWCLGNEMDGPWQMGHKTACEYGRIANESAKMMKWVDPTIELVACGSSNSEMPTFGSWELTMLDECYENIDYVSLHRYYGNMTNDTPGFLARSMDLNDFIRTVIAICDAVKGKKHSKKQINLSFDEWNVWYHSNEQDKEIWKNMNIMTRTGGGCWAQTIYWPFLHASKYGRGTSLLALVDSPVYSCADYDDVPLINAAATRGDDGSVTVFCVNRDLTEDFVLDIDLRAFGGLTLQEHILLHHDDVKAVNTEDNPENVVPGPGPGGTTENGRAQIRVPALSWNVLRFRHAKE